MDCKFHFVLAQADQLSIQIWGCDEVRYFWKVLVPWGMFMILSLALVVFTNWDRTLIGLTIGILIGFLPSFILKVLSDLREWNIENIEKVYAPLMSEVDDLFTYFLGAKEADAYTLFDYGEIRAGLLSNSKWEQIRKDNLFFRVYLDDRTLAEKLLSFYLSLSFYMKNRMEFLHSTLDPIFSKILTQVPNTQTSTMDLLRKIQIATKNIVLDAREPSDRAITLGFYAELTTLFSDYSQVRIAAGIPEKTFDAFLAGILKKIADKKYDLLLEQRKNLLRDVHEVRSMLQKKLQQARPV